MAGALTYPAVLLFLDRDVAAEVGTIARDLVSRSKA